MTLVIVLLSVSLFFVPTAGFALDVHGLSGQPWQLWSGHLTHFSFDHLIWCVVAFAALGWTCERDHRAAARVTMVASAMTVGCAVVLLAPELDEYRGLSGVTSALFGLLATVRLIEQIRTRDYTQLGLTMLMATGFLLKLVWETTGQGMFVDTSAGGFTPVPIAHVVGLLTGISVGLFRGWRSPATSSSRKFVLCSRSGERTRLG